MLDNMKIWSTWLANPAFKFYSSHELSKKIDNSAEPYKKKVLSDINKDTKWHLKKQNKNDKLFSRMASFNLWSISFLKSLAFSLVFGHGLEHRNEFDTSGRDLWLSKYIWYR